MIPIRSHVPMADRRKIHQDEGYFIAQPKRGGQSLNRLGHCTRANNVDLVSISDNFDSVGLDSSLQGGEHRLGRGMEVKGVDHEVVFEAGLSVAPDIQQGIVIEMAVELRAKEVAAQLGFVRPAAADENQVHLDHDVRFRRSVKAYTIHKSICFGATS